MSSLELFFVLHLPSHLLLSIPGDYILIVILYHMHEHIFFHCMKFCEPIFCLSWLFIVFLSIIVMNISSYAFLVSPCNCDSKY